MASNRKPDIDDIFRSKLENYPSEVPTSLWGKISAELDQEVTLNHQTPRFGRVISLSWVIRIAAGLLLFGFIIWNFQGEEKIYLTAENKKVDDLAPKTPQDLSKTESDGFIEQNSQEVLGLEADSDQSSTADGQDRNERRLAYNQMGSNVNETGTVHTVVEPGMQAVESTSMAVQNELADQEMVITEAPDRVAVLADELEVGKSMNAEVIVANVEGENVVIKPVFEEFTESQELKNHSERSETSDQSPIRDRPKVLSGVLNFVASNLQVGGNQVVQFNETDQGILLVDVKGVFDR